MKFNKEKGQFRTDRRRLVTKDEAQFDLKEVIPKLFLAFGEAYILYKSEVVKTPPNSRCRGFEANLMNSKVIQRMQFHFPDNMKRAKYGRFIMNISGYIILFKKLDGKNMPMNIKTMQSDGINKQLKISLFEEAGFYEEPILFFGYGKDVIGRISEPKLVYLDEGKIKWIISESQSTNLQIEIPTEIKEIAKPTLKKRDENRKKSS